MPDGDEATQPKVPNEPAAPFSVASLRAAEVVPDPQAIVQGPDSPDYNMLLGSGLIPPALAAGYAVEGGRASENFAEYIEAQADKHPDGKISKQDVFYAPQAPLPFGVWEYKCRTCRFYQPDSETDGEGPKCEVVGQRNDPFGRDRIHPEAWCTLWLPGSDEPWFNFARNRLEGVVD